MMMPIEIPITVIKNGQNYTQIVPSPAHDMYPEGRELKPVSLDARFTAWLKRPDLRNTREQTKELLVNVGKNVLNIRKDELLPLLQLGTPGHSEANSPIPKRRILTYTDSASSTIPFETLYSDDEYLGPINFITANSHFLVSIVRHLGLEATKSLEINSKKNLQMLIIFSNPEEHAKKLGDVWFDDAKNEIGFSGCLDDEKKALEQQLGILIQLGLLEAHFLVGDETSKSVYSGQVLYDSRLLWRATKQQNSLQGVFLNYLNKDTDNNSGCYWHILHYFGHGVGNENPELELIPGNNLSCTDLGNKVSRTPRIVILNACITAFPTDFNAPTPTGFATIFLKRGTVNLICMQEKVTPQTATLTTKEVYRRLSYSLFTRQYDFEEALYEVRKKVYDHRYDFFCPVLYARPVDGPIFAYKDKRLSLWNSVVRGGGGLPLNPIKLGKIISWSRKVTTTKL